MQILVKFSLVVLVALSACSTSNHVNNASVFQKRKYTKGWNINRSSNTAKTNTTPKTIGKTEQSINLEDTIASEQAIILADTSNALIVHPQQNTIHQTQIQETAPEPCDVITLKTGEEIQAEIIEINEETVKYKKCEEGNSIVYSKSIFSVFSIKYKNGSKEVFNKEEPKKNQDQKVDKTEPKSIVSLILSLTGLVVGFTFILSVLGIIFGNIALKKIKQNNTKGEEMALWGKILGWIGLIWGVIYLIYLLAEEYYLFY